MGRKAGPFFFFFTNRKPYPDTSGNILYKNQPSSDKFSQVQPSLAKISQFQPSLPKFGKAEQIFPGLEKLGQV